VRVNRSNRRQMTIIATTMLREKRDFINNHTDYFTF